jgi:antitoxin component of MazEF toxin-antitoxin module
MQRLNLGSRSVQNIGRTLYVNLPKTWAENFNIRKGDEVLISLQEDGSLNISIFKESNDGGLGALFGD